MSNTETTKGQSERNAKLVLLSLATLTTVATCISLAYTSFYHPELLSGYNSDRLPAATLIVIPFAVMASSFFLIAEFSFGYFVGFYLYVMIGGFLFLNVFTDRSYDHQLAAISAIASALAFLLPALFLKRPLKSLFSLSTRAFDALLATILFLALITLVIGAAYNFVGFRSFGEFRDELFTAQLRNRLSFPIGLGYAIGILSSALLPFAFAVFISRAQYWKALISLVLLLLFFPVTLSKTALFTPAWLVFVAILGRFFELRIAALATLAVPVLIGSSAALLGHRNDVFDLLAFRMIDIPSTALAVYNEYFAQHEQTYLCHLSLAKVMMTCPYRDQLGVLMAKQYGLGNYNASLFATEGIASVGLRLAPISALACGLLIGFGNCLSGRLPANVIFISGAVLAQVILNVPLSTALLTHGAGILFLLWYVSPPEVFPIELTKETR